MTEPSKEAMEAAFLGVLRRYGDREDMDHPLIRRYVSGILEDALLIERERLLKELAEEFEQFADSSSSDGSWDSAATWCRERAKRALVLRGELNPFSIPSSTKEKSDE